MEANFTLDHQHIYVFYLNLINYILLTKLLKQCIRNTRRTVCSLGEIPSVSKLAVKMRRKN